jgi:hypothetical protein
MAVRPTKFVFRAEFSLVTQFGYNDAREDYRQRIYSFLA